MTTVFGIFLLTLLFVTSIGIVRAKDLFVAVMLSGIYSLQIAAVFFILDAADVALTEAAVGAGVATVLMLGALALISREERAATGTRWFALAVVAVTTLLVVYATFDQPRLGDPGAPVHQHVAPWYLAETTRLIDVPNVVTAILASFRGYDTLGELFVIFTAGIGVMFILAVPREPRNGGEPSIDSAGLRHHLIPRVVGRLLVPFIVLFGLYVQFHGDYGPGGGFQAGALIAAGLILHALIEGERAALRVVHRNVLLGLIVGGALLYTGVGIAGMLLGGAFLDYSVLRADPVAGQHLGILLVELGVGMTVTGVLLTIFHAFAARASIR
jgi:multicomponent Na+:H+ antiporter subunit B